MGNALIVAICHNRAATRLRGYQDGDTLELVHEVAYGYIGPDWTGISEPRLNLPVRRSWPLSPSLPRRVAAPLARTLNGAWSSEWERAISTRYHAKGLRPVETGDVFVTDPGGPLRAALARHFSGWFTVTGPLSIIVPEGARS